MEQEENIEKQVKEFESNNIYLQWLYRRQAMPMRINLILVKYIWIAAVVFTLLSFIETWTDPVLEILQGILGFIVFGWPIITLFLYFLLFAPMAVESDSRSSFMQFVFISPVPTREIVSNLRIFIFRQHFVTAIPALAVMLILFMYHEGLNFFKYMDSFDFTNFVLIGAIPILIWWFLLESGIASAGLHKIAYSSGMVFLLWIVPVLVAVFWGGYYISTWHANFWFHLFGQPTWRDYYDYSTPLSFLDREQWLVVHFDIFLLIAVLTARRFSYRFMACKRAGYWGA